MDESPKRGLLAAYGRLLRPLIRILIRNGVSFSEFADVAKHAYVEVAEKDFSVENKKISQDRISALTGLMRREVQDAINIKTAQEQDQGSNLNRIVAILTGWHTDSDYTGPYGVPAEVQLKSDGGTDFSELVRRHAGNRVSPKTLLDEMVRAGVAVETERGWFKVISRYYIPLGSAPAGLEHLSRTLQDLVTTIEHNLLEPGTKKKLFERHVYTEEGIRPEDLPLFEEFATKKAKLLLEEIDNWLSQLEKPNTPIDDRISTGLGIFHYIHHGDPDDK